MQCDFKININDMERETLNQMELAVYNLCLSHANEEEEGGFCYEETGYQNLGLSLKQMKGYLSQLCQKGYIFKAYDCYFSHYISDIWNKYNER